MKCEWKTVKIGDLGTVITGKTPTTKNINYWNGNVQFITPKDLQGTKHIFQTERTITRRGLETVKGCVLPSNSVCVSCIGNIGYTGVTTQLCITNQQINSIIVDKNNNTDFIYYLIKKLWLFFKNCEGQSTTLSILNKTQFSNIEVSVPDLETQKKIAKILSSLDDKIELNNAINHNLQQQAQAIFKSWFIDFEPFGGKMPDDWKVVTLEQITTLISRGISPKYIDDSDQMVLNQKCIRNHMIDLSLARNHIPKVVNEKWIRFGDLLINSTGDGTLGRVAQVWFKPKNLTVDSHITVVRPANQNLNFYVGFWAMAHEKEIEALHTGSTGQTELPRDRVKEMKLFLPDNFTLSNYNVLISPITANIISNLEENNNLKLIRDTLLPKLMSGQLDISEIEI